MTAYPGCAGLARSPFVLTEHISSRSSMEKAIRIYIYIYIYIYVRHVYMWYVRHVYMWYVRHTFVARSWSDVMWEELSVSHF